MSLIAVANAVVDPRAMVVCEAMRFARIKLSADAPILRTQLATSVSLSALQVRQIDALVTL